MDTCRHVIPYMSHFLNLLCVQEAVQVYQNTFNYYQNLIDSILPVVVILFAGSLSDRYGRKLPLATVLAGFVAFSVIYIVTALNPNWPVEVLYAATIAVDVTGSWVGLYHQLFILLLLL